MSEKITVFNRRAYPLICDEVGHTLAPGRSREVDASDHVASSAIAVGSLGVVEPTPEPVPEVAPARSRVKKTTTSEAPAPAENEE